MAATLIVDGYNVIMATKTGKDMMLEDLKKARDYIVRVSEKYARSTGFITRVKVIFDGDDKYRVLEELQVSNRDIQVFSEMDKCDDEIIRMSKLYVPYGRVFVVSNDNYVRNGCRPYASLMRPEDLFPRKTKKNAKEGTIEPKRVDKKTEDRITEEYRRELGI